VRQDANRIQLRNACRECVVNEFEVRFGVSSRQEAREAILNVNAPQTQVIEQQRRVGVLTVND